MKKNPLYHISIIIPVYKGAETLPELLEKLAIELPKICAKYEVILVNDGSPDNSWEVISTFSKRYPWIRGIKLMRNYGQQNATLCGVRHARYPITVTMDDDLQHPPEEIHKLLEKFAEGFDVVYGSPQQLPNDILRNMTTRVTKKLLSYVMGVPSMKHISAFCAFRTNLRNSFTNFQSPDFTLDVLLSWGTSKFSYVYVNLDKAKKSNYDLFKLAGQALLILTGFSTAPLRIATITGFLMTIVGLSVLIYVMIIYFSEGSIPGFTFLASIIALFSGTQLFSLGIFGEYLGTIFKRSMDKPAYIIEETIERTSR
jgi:glycosyltransferase involved in cell wall biosynthesis